MEESDQLHAFTTFISVYRIRGCVGPKADLDAVEKRQFYFHCRESKVDSSAVNPVT
jgi:hypothetical protein